MKAVLVQPPIHDFYLSPHRLSALGLRSLIPFLESRGWEWELLNFPLMRKKGIALPLPEELSHLRPFIFQGETGPVTWFSRYARFGPDRAACTAAVKKEQPDLLLISCFAWAYAGETLEHIADLKAALPGVPLIVGGHGAAVMPDYFSGPGKADLVFKGEAEIGFPDLLAALEMNQKDNWIKILSRQKQALKKFTRGDALTPVWAGPSSQKKPQFTVMLSRGCPRKCRFCSNHLVYGREFRTPALSEVLKSIEALPAAGPFSVNFEDDNLLLNKEYFLAILEKLKNFNPDFSFTAENGMDYSLLNEALLTRLHTLGLKQLNISLAVSSAALGKNESRFLDLPRLKGVLAAAGALKLPVVTYFIAGLQGDTPDSAVEALLFLSSLNTTIGISPFYPVPGLPGLAAVDFNTLYPGLCRGSSAYPWTNSLSTTQLITAFRLSRFANLLKNTGYLPGGSPGGAGGPSAEERELIGVCLNRKQLYTVVKNHKHRIICAVPDLDILMMDKYLSIIKKMILTSPASRG